MDIKSTLKKEAAKALKKEAEKAIIKKAIIKKATGKILPMVDAPEKKLGWKTTVAAALAFIAATAAGLLQIING